MVFGATGYTGRLVAERLRRPGHASGARRALRGEAARAGRAARRARVGGRRRAPRDVDVRPRPPRRRAGLDGRAVRALGRAGGARRGGRRRRATWTPRASRRSSAACSPSSTRRPGTRARSLHDGHGLRLRAGRAGRGARAARGGRERRPRRRRLLRARRRAELDVARHARVDRGHRARALLRLPRRRGAHRALGGADALLRRRRASRGRPISVGGAEHFTVPPVFDHAAARSTSTSAGSARWRRGSRRRRG